MIGNAFVLAVRQISRNPLRSLLTVLGVVIGVMAVITMVTVGNGASQAIRTQIESFGNNQLMLRPGLRMGPGQSVGAPNFTLEDADALKRQIAGIVAVAPQASKTMTVVANGRNWQTSVIGTDNNYFTIDNREIVDGRTFEQGEMQSGAAVCVIGGTIQKELFGEGAEVIGRTIRTGSFSCRVVGLLKTKGTAAMGGDQDDLLVMPIKTLQRRILGKNRVGALLVSVNPQSDRDRLRDAVTELMRERRSLSDGDDDNFQILDTAEIAAKVASKTLRHLLNRDDNPLPASSIFINIARAVIWMIGGSFILDNCFGINANALVAALGVGGIAISLGFQDTLSNLIGGMQVTFMGIIKPGDNIEVGGVSGVVQDITWRHTTIEDACGQTIIVPNSNISKNTLVHLMPFGRVVVPVAVKDTSKWDSLDALADELACATKVAVSPISGFDKEPYVLFSEIGDFGIKGKIIFIVSDDSTTFTAADACIRAIAPIIA